MEEIASRMLQGWKMLAIHCPICSTVLLQKDEEIFCAACNARCVHESNATIIQGTDSAFEHNQLKTSHKVEVKPPKAGTGANDRFAERMLAGWTMLDGSCLKQREGSGCDFPLLQARDGRKYCVGCDAYVSEEGENQPSDRDVTSQKTAPMGALEQSNCIDKEESFGAAGPVMNKEEWASYRAHRDKVSSELGKKLVQGWVMTEKACSCHTPLMKRPMDQALVCVACDLKHQNQETIPIQEQGEPPTTAGSRKTHPKSLMTTEYISKKLGDTEDVSDQIGAALLKGWTLLADVCNVMRCATPLMRDKNNQIWCLKCNKVVLPPQSSESSSNSKVTPAVHSPVNRDDEYVQEPPQTLLHNSGGMKRKSNGALTLEKAVDFLTQEIAGAQARIQATNSVTDKIEHVKLMLECVKALNAFQNLGYQV